MVVRRPSEEVAIDETTPLVPNRTPFRELAKVVTPLTLSEPRLAILANKLVELAVVENRLVEVALPATSEDEYIFVEVELVVVELLTRRLVIVVVANVVVPVTPKLPPIVCPPDTSEPTVRAPPTVALPETFKLASVVLPATNDPPIAVLPPIVVLEEIFKEFPLKFDAPPVMPDEIAVV